MRRSAISSFDLALVCPAAVCIAVILGGCTRAGFTGWTTQPVVDSGPAEAGRTEAGSTEGGPTEGGSTEGGTGRWGSGQWVFGAVEAVSAVNTPSGEYNPVLSVDGKTLYFASSGLKQSQRAARGAPFGPPERIDGFVGTVPPERLTEIQGGLVAYAVAKWPGTVGGTDIWRASRSSRTERWAQAAFTSLPFNTPGHDWDVWPSTDDQLLYFGVTEPGTDILVARRPAPGEPFDAPVPVTGVNSAEDEGNPTLSPDGRVIVFARSTAASSTDLYFAVRRAGDPAAFEDAQPLAQLNTPSSDAEPALSPAGDELFFTSARPGGAGEWDIYRVEILSGP